MYGPDFSGPPDAPQHYGPYSKPMTPQSQVPVYGPDFRGPARGPHDYGAYPPPPGYPPTEPHPLAVYQPGPGARIHDGFFLRLTLGAGAGGTRYHEDFDGVRLAVTNRGFAGLFEVGVGGSIKGNWILHANFIYTLIGDAERGVDGDASPGPDIDIGMGMVGGGVSYYFMPLNVYLTGVGGVAGLIETRLDGTAVESRAGFGAMIALGKEWWVGQSGEWGFGAALRSTFYTARADIVGHHGRVYGHDVGLSLTTTLN